MLQMLNVLSVSLWVTSVSSAKIVEQTEMPLGGMALWGCQETRIMIEPLKLLMLLLLLSRTFIWRTFARAKNVLCRQRWQYGYIAVYVSIAIYITNCQDR